MSRRRKPRALREDEEAIWKRVADTARPLHPEKTIKRGTAAAPPKTIGRTPAPIPQFEIGSKARTSTAAPVAAKGPSVNLDRKAFARLKRGRSQPEARLDLHGMTLAQAEPALHRFLSSAQARGLRLVLVITGKGQGRDDWGPIPEAPGILKRTIPAWLAADPSVLQVTEAHQRHGGAGAFYVTLRRAK